MPNGDHPAPTYEERKSRETCIHIIYLCEMTHEPYPHWVSAGADAFYGIPSHMEEAAKRLGKMCSEVDESVIYNARDRRARALADWWEEYQEKEKLRAAKELAAHLHAKVIIKLNRLSGSALEGLLADLEARIRGGE